MEIKNRTASFWGVVLSDPSAKRFLQFMFLVFFIGSISLLLEFAPDSIRKNSAFFKENEIIIVHFINVLICVCLFFILKMTKVGGSADHLLKNREKLRNKIILITGGYKGIGLAATEEFLKCGSEIILACRSVEYMKTVTSDLIKKYPDAKIHNVELDLRSFEIIQKCANQLLTQFPRIDIIINNAGFLTGKATYIYGLESLFLTNYFGHFYLTHLLFNRILSNNTLVVNMSSIAHAGLRKSDLNFDYIFEEKAKRIPRRKSLLNYKREYNFSKLCMFYFTQELQRRFELEATKACSVAINPGLVKTDLFRSETKWFSSLIKGFLFPKTPLQGCQTILYVCLLDRNDLDRGNYYSDCKLECVRSYMKDSVMSQKLWKLSETIVKDRIMK